MDATAWAVRSDGASGAFRFQSRLAALPVAPCAGYLLWTQGTEGQNPERRRSSIPRPEV